MKVVALLLPLVAGLNVLMTSSDSWVSKNSRYLYRALLEEGHNVVYVGPLYSASALHERSEIPSGSEFNEGGDFNHLLPEPQNYYKYVRKLNALDRGAKNVITKEDSKSFDAQLIARSLVNHQTYGQDPLNTDFWYVNGSPLESLAVAFSEILPKHLQDFKPDLVIVGPNKGLHLSTSTEKCDNAILEEDLIQNNNEVEAMVHLAQVHNYPTISISLDDEHHVYYQDEDYFNVEEKLYSKLFKDNLMAKSTKFVCDKIVEVVGKTSQLLNNHISLNINFPPMNEKSTSCLVRENSQLTFKQVIRGNGITGALGKVLNVPKFKVTKDEILPNGAHYYKISDELAVSTVLTTLEVQRLQHLFGKEKRSSDNVDANSYNEEESSALYDCNIAVSVNHISRGNNLNVLNLVNYI